MEDKKTTASPVHAAHPVDAAEELEAKVCIYVATDQAITC